MALTFYRSEQFAAPYFRVFWAGGSIRDIVDTDAIQKPVDYALAGQQLIKDRYREFEIHAPNVRETTKVTRSGVQRLGGGTPTFTTRSGSLGGSHK